MSRRKRQGGSTIVEFTLTGVPMIFVWISIVQMCIGMWNYHTLQYALKKGGSYLSAHGSSTGYCSTNNCRIEEVAAVISQYATGMPRSSINLTFIQVTSSIDHATTGTSTSCTLDACLTNATAFPNGAPEFEIKAEYQFKNALGMVAFGGSPVKFGNPWFPAYTHQIVLY
jgi:Flp pilus assembly protein TadG